jgi:hypothetical protein
MYVTLNYKVRAICPSHFSDLPELLPAKYQLRDKYLNVKFELVILRRVYVNVCKCARSNGRMMIQTKCNHLSYGKDFSLILLSLILLPANSAR